MNDHNLDDLIIDNIEPKNSKTKSFLTIIALLIVVLIVGIILTKIILKDPNAEKIAFEENNTEMISPELTLQSAAEPEVKKEEPKLSSIIEESLKASVKAPKVPKEEVVKETKPLKEPAEIVSKEVIEIPKEAETKTEVENSAKAEEERLAQEKAAQEKIAKDKLEKEKAEAEKVIIEEKIQKTVKPVPPKMIEKAKVKPTGRPVNVPVKSTSTTSQAYYIQVGSFTKIPSKQFLGIIKNSGFNYKITPKAANGTKKLLIGPYKNRASANDALARVKDRINKNAFVVKK
jgi:DedD protein